MLPAANNNNNNNNNSLLDEYKQECSISSSRAILIDGKIAIVGPRHTQRHN